MVLRHVNQDEKMVATQRFCYCFTRNAVSKFKGIFNTYSCEFEVTKEKLNIT